jgi:hypothetical protein
MYCQRAPRSSSTFVGCVPLIPSATTLTMTSQGALTMTQNSTSAPTTFGLIGGLRASQVPRMASLSMGGERSSLSVEERYARFFYGFNSADYFYLSHCAKPASLHPTTAIQSLFIAAHFHVPTRSEYAQASTWHTTRSTTTPSCCYGHSVLRSRPTPSPALQ